MQKYPELRVDHFEFCEQMAIDINNMGRNFRESSNSYIVYH